MKEITSINTEICLYCGEDKKIRKKGSGFFIINESYCDCEDIRINEEIDKQIEELEDSRPKHKFYISKKSYLESYLVKKDEV